jgi:hypothetical protein
MLALGKASLARAKAAEPVLVTKMKRYRNGAVMREFYAFPANWHESVSQNFNPITSR